MTTTQHPTAWTIAGSDSGGGAGIQADLRAMQALGVHGCSVMTASTAQNSQGVTDIEVMRTQHIQAQITALRTDLPAQAIKLGMLANSEVINTVMAELERLQVPIICDPVMVSTSGADLLSPDAIQILIERVFSQCVLVTPNRIEVARLLNCELNTAESVEHAAQRLLAMGCQSVLIKGGHSSDELLAADYWTDGNTHFWLTSPRFCHDNNHGSGCTLSAAIAATIAQGYEMRDALVIAKMLVNQGMRQAMQIGEGPGPLQPTHWPDAQSDLPMLSAMPLEHLPQAFRPCCELSSLGLYPIVERAEQLAALIPSGATTFQLRNKDLTGESLEQEIQQAVAIAETAKVRLFINDYWQLAIKHHAYGVHLGQEDLDSADINAIREAGLRLGISTHSFYEVARAHSINPSYMAFGPVYETDSKPMAFGPQGIAQLQYWQQLLDYPLVAIGGINQQRMSEVVKTGASGVAMISAITRATNPVQAAQHFMRQFSEN